MGKVIGTVPPEYQPFYYKPSSEYYASMVEEKFGFSTAGGDSLVIPAEFDFATNFEGNIARVNIGAVLNEEQWEYSGGKWGLIDRSGKKIMPVENELILPFHNSLALFNVGGETTYRLCDGECSEPVQYSCVGGKWGILDPSGKVVIEAKYNSIVPFGNNFLVAEDSIYSLIDPSGNVIYPVKLTPEFPEVNDYGMVTLFEDEFVKASENGKVGILDRNGKWILPPQYDGVSVLSNVKSTPFKDGKVLVNIGGLWGVADESGSIVIPVAYENMRGFSEGLAPVRSNALWGFINEKNEMQIAPQFYAVRDFQGDVAIVQPRHDSEEGVINTSGKMLIAPKPGVTFDYKGFVHGLCLISATQHSEAVGYPVMTTGVVNSKGTVLFNQNELTDARIQPDGLLYVVKNGRWAIANHNGAMLSGYNYSWIEPYSGQALIRCNIGGTVTYNDYGEEEDAYGGRWGFIDRNGAVKIKFSFSEVGSFKDGLAPASTSDDLDEIGYVNRNGRFIRPVTK